LQHRGLLPSGSLKGVVGGRGFLNTGKELTILAKVLTAHGRVIIAKTPITAEEIERCKQLARQLSDSDATRARSAQASVNAALLRQRAYTLLMLSYNEVQRCIAFLDPAAAPRVVPTLSPSRKRKQKGEAQGG
jgi:hypothetical protein